MFYNDIKEKTCRTCSDKRPGDAAQHSAQPKKLDQIVYSWAGAPPADGVRDLTPDEQKPKDRKEQFENAIEMMTNVGGQDEAVKQMERELKTNKNTDLVNLNARDTVSLAKPVQDAEESGQRTFSAAEETLQQKSDERDKIVQKFNTMTKDLKEKYDREFESLQAKYDVDKPKADQQIETELQQLDDLRV